MKKQIVRISILQSSKIVTALYILFGLFYTIPGIFMIVFGGKARIFGIVYCAMPVVMAVFGFVFFVIAAAIYNALAKWLGGFEFEVKEIE